MGLLDSIRNLLGGKPEPEQQQQPPAVDEPAPATVQEKPPLELAAGPGAESPYDRMRAAGFQLSPDNPDYDAFAAARDAEPAVSETPGVDTADVGEQGGDVEGQDGRFGEHNLQTPLEQKEQPGQWVPGPVGPGGSRSFTFVPSQNEQQQEGPAAEQPDRDREEPAPDRAGPAPGDCPTFEDMNPEPDIGGMDL